MKIKEQKRTVEEGHDCQAAWVVTQVRHHNDIVRQRRAKGMLYIKVTFRRPNLQNLYL